MLNGSWGTPAFASLGDRAIAVSLPDADSGSLLRLLAAMAGMLRASAGDWLEDAVPAYDTVTVVYDPMLAAKLPPAGARSGQRFAGFWASEASGPDFPKAADERLAPEPAVRRSPGRAASRALPELSLQAIPYEKAVSEIARLLGEIGPEDAAAEPRTIEIPVCYGGACGPDLAESAARSGMSESEFVSRHSAGLYTVAMIGFMPGFPYLTGLPPELAQPRRASPRSRVPAGSVGIGGGQTGVYPLASPGGWQLIGRTPLQLFHPLRAEPSLLRAGDRLRFVPAPEIELPGRGAER